MSKSEFPFAASNCLIFSFHGAHSLRAEVSNEFCSPSTFEQAGDDGLIFKSKYVGMCVRLWQKFVTPTLSAGIGTTCIFGFSDV